MTRSSRSGGWLLWEMTIAVALMAVFGLVSARVLTLTLKTMHGAGQAQDRLFQSESVLRRLRPDAWASRSVRPIPNGVRLTLDAGDIDWTADGPDLLRTTGQQTLRWRDAAVGTTLQPTRVGVVLIHSDKSNSQRLSLPSQLLLLEAQPR